MNISFREVTPADAEALARVLITGMHTAFQAVVPEQCLQFSEAESAANWRTTLTEGLDPGDFMILAQTTAKEVVGYAWGSPHTNDGVYQGELKQIIILPAYQGQGLGRRLVSQVAARLTAQGVTSMRVEVLRDNPHRAFYERLGAQYLFQHPYDWDGVIMPSYVYGWEDMRVLLLSGKT